MRIVCLLLMALMAGAWALHTPANAQIIFSHTGSTDPTTEGWSASVGSSVSAVGAINGSTPVWRVVDIGTEPGSTLTYTVNPSAPQVADAAARGWTLTVQFDLLSSESLSTHAALYNDGATAWGMQFGTSMDGDPTVQLQGGSLFELDGAGSSGLHLYQLVYDPGFSRADLFVDSNLAVSGYMGQGFVFPAAIQWGASNGGLTGQGDYDVVLFDIHPVPEPSTYALLAFASLAFVGYQWRKKRRRNRLP